MSLWDDDFPYESFESKSGDFVAHLYVDQSAPNPRQDFDHFVHVLTINDFGRFVNVDDDGGPLQYIWDRIAMEVPDEHAVEVFERYVRIFHGGVVLEHHDPENGPHTLWYLTGLDVETHGIGDPEAFVRSERDEYAAWASGDCWGFVVEERVVYERAIKTGDTGKDWMWRYERTDDSCWGIYGYEWAASMARDAATCYDPEPIEQ